MFYFYKDAKAITDTLQTNSQLSERQQPPNNWVKPTASGSQRRVRVPRQGSQG
jgi:hypothetical protein